MQATSVVVLVIDRLGVGWLGPYGNTWLDTPNFNRLASSSVLCETVVADAPDLAASYRAFLTGRHALAAAVQSLPSLPQSASAANVANVLLTDDNLVVEQPLAGGFSQRQAFSTKPVSRCADSVEQTGLFAFFEAAAALIREPTRPGLVWLHSQGMNGPWDAPLELRYQFADEEDPEPPDFVAPPNVLLPDNFDPDQLLGYVQAYAGQVALADMCLGLLLNAIAEHPLADQTLLVVTSPRGYPLGEHRRVGPCDEALYGELLQVPLLIQFPGRKHSGARSQQILRPHELYSLIAESCGWQNAPLRESHVLRELESDSPMDAKVAVAVSDRERAIRTPAWFLRESHIDGEQRRELFAKPDDRWEANEVSSRCTDAVELLAAELDSFEAAARDGEVAKSPPLAEVLCDVWR